MENTLIPMTDFVLQNKANFEGYKTEEYGTFSYNHLIRIEDYANFLKKPLELSMFVPVGEDGNVLKEPTFDCYMQPKEMDRQYSVYKDAKDKVIFKGFELISINNEISIAKNISKDLYIGLGFKNGAHKIIEDLTNLGLELITNK